MFLIEGSKPELKQEDAFNARPFLKSFLANTPHIYWNFMFFWDASEVHSIGQHAE